MEFTLPTLTLSALLASFSGDGLSNSPVITTHTKPLIAGQWQILLEKSKPTSSNLQENTLPVTATPEEKEHYLKEIFTHNNTAIKSIYKQKTDHYDLPVIITIEENRTLLNQPDSPDSQKLPIEEQCRELYNFDQDYQVRVSSGAELTLGTYLISHQDEGLPIILITTTYDNNLKDCSGIQIDQTGESMVAYLNYTDNKMSWCSDPLGEKCSVHFNRVYP